MPLDATRMTNFVDTDLHQGWEVTFTLSIVPRRMPAPDTIWHEHSTPTRQIPAAPVRREKWTLAPNILVKYSMDSTLDFGFRFSHFRNTNVSQNYSTSLTKHTRHLFLPFESLNHRDWKERGICHQKFPLVDVSKLRLSFVWKSTTDMFWRWNEEPKDQNYVWQYHSKIIPRSLKEKNIWALVEKLLPGSVIQGSPSLVIVVFWDI